MLGLAKKPAQPKSYKEYQYLVEKERVYVMAAKWQGFSKTFRPEFRIEVIERKPLTVGFCERYVQYKKRWYRLEQIFCNSRVISYPCIWVEGEED